MEEYRNERQTLQFSVRMKNVLLKNVFHATTSEYHRHVYITIADVVTVQKWHFYKMSKLT